MPPTVRRIRLGTILALLLLVTLVPLGLFAGRLVYSSWLQQQAESLKKNSPSQAQALAGTLEMLGKCYRGKEAGAEITVMQGLGALISPERKGLFAEKLALPDTTVQCLPA